LETKEGQPCKQHFDNGPFTSASALAQMIGPCTLLFQDYDITSINRSKKLTVKKLDQKELVAVRGGESSCY
jgi:hypothetical protein